MRRVIAIFSAALVGVLLAIVGFTIWGLQPHEQDDHRRFCFGEWCVMPTTLTSVSSSTVVRVSVRSDAIASTQRPDHPQAWLVDRDGRMTGGPQGQLDLAVGPQQEYSVDLTFRVAAAGCLTFLVSEGAWPSFLHLGYAPSPFSERASWRLCP